MVLKNDYNKDFLIINEENIIYRKLFRKITIKKSDIRSVFYDKNYLGILTYSGEIYSLSIKSLLWSDRNKLEDLRKELNKENILFDYTNMKSMRNIFPFYLIFMSILSGVKNIKFQMLLLLIFIIVIIYINKIDIFDNTVFNIEKDELEIIRRKGIVKYKKHEIDKIELKRYYDGVTTIEFKKNENKYSISFKDNPYLIKIYNISLIKLFN